MKFLPLLSRSIRRAGRSLPLLAAFMLVVGCGGPRLRWLTEQRPAPLPDHIPVEVYVGSIQPAPDRIAIIETSATPHADETSRRAQLEELKQRARRVGANAIEDVRILTKEIQGFTLDERTPFFSWRQGRYPLYFMRGTAIVIEELEPADLDDLSPPEGWMVDRQPVPPRLD